MADMQKPNNKKTIPISFALTFSWMFPSPHPYPMKRQENNRIHKPLVIYLALSSKGGNVDVIPPSTEVRHVPVMLKYS